MHFQQPMLGVPLDWSNPLNDEIVMALAMNEGHGDKVQDLSMNGNHGTLVGFAYPPTVASGWNPGQTGVGLNFDGTDDYVDCGNDASLNITDAITISTWVNFNSFLNTPYLIYAGSYNIWVGDGYIQAWNVLENVSGKTLNTPPSSLTVGEWNHIVVTYDKDGAGDNWNIYINGILNASDASWSDKIDTGSFLGCRITNAGTSNSVNGSINQVRIHNRALTAKEVKDYAMNPWQVYLDEDDN